MKTVKAKIKGTDTILEGSICDDSFFVSIDHDTFERYDLDEVELCEPNPNSLTLEEAAEKFVGYDMDCDELRDHEVSIAAFITGAEWQKSQMAMPEDTVLFNKGVAEGRRLEREDITEVETELVDAVEKYVVQGCSRSTLLAKKDKLKKLIEQ